MCFMHLINVFDYLKIHHQKTGKYVKELSLSLSLIAFFNRLYCLWKLLKKCTIFSRHITLSQPMVKIIN